MKNLSWILLSLSFLLVVSGCVDRDFDAPPVFEASDPDIDDSSIISIASVKAMQSGEFTQLNLDMYIRATVVADDQSGNFFKSLVIQDESGGITILLDDVELWNRFKVGRRVFIDLNRIWMGEFNGLPQLGFEPFLDDSNRLSMARIPAAEINDIVLGGVDTGMPEPVMRNITNLSVSDLNTLVQLEGVEFASGSDNTSFADADNAQSINHTLEDCNSNSIIVRSSGFASFASALTPAGNGSIVGIYGVFGDDQQILIRDLNDVNMQDARCDGSTGGGGPVVVVDESKVVTVRSVLDMRVEGVETNIGSDSFLKGIVVSSDELGNFFKTIVIQDETGGIAILADMNDTYIDYAIGSEVYVALQDLFISDFNGLPQLGYAPSSSSVKRIPEGLVSNIIITTGSVNFVNATELSIDNLSDDNLNTFISLTDVQFDDASVGNTFADGINSLSLNNTIVDCDGNEVILRTSGFADFADNRIPGGNGSIRGVLQTFQGTLQMFINFSEDVDFRNDRCDGTTGGGNPGGGDDGISLDFEDQEVFDAINIEGWLNVSGKGDRVWLKREFSENGYAEATAFQDDEPETDMWLVSPVINTAETNTLSFISAMAFYRHDGLSLKYTTDFSGDVNTTTWSDISNVRLARESDEEHEWIPSGDVGLVSLGNEIQIAFHYQGTGAGNTTTFRIDDVMIE